MRDSRKLKKKKKKKILTLRIFSPEKEINNLFQNFVINCSKPRFEVMGDYDSASSRCSSDTHEWHAHARTGRGVTSMAGTMGTWQNLIISQVSGWVVVFSPFFSFFLFSFFFPPFLFFSSSLIQDVNSLEIHQSAPLTPGSGSVFAQPKTVFA